MDEVERYQKLLEDWSWSGKPPAKSGSAASAPAAPLQSVSAPAAPRPGAPAGMHHSGAILCLNGQTIAIYKQAVPDKDYHLALVMLPNGAVKTQGIYLSGQDAVDEIGMLPAEMLEKLSREMRWTRDLIVFHCYTYNDAVKVPQSVAAPVAAAVPDRSGPLEETSTVPLSAVAGASAAARPQAVLPRDDVQPAAGGMKRGQRLMVRFGDKMWTSVYWGKDDKGQVVAHKTNKDWTLMHLDLNRFGTDLVVDPAPDAGAIIEIEASINNQK